MVSNTLRLIFYYYSHFSSTLLSKNNRAYSKIQAKEQAYLYSRDYTINHAENEDKNEKRSPRSGINRPRFRPGCKYSKCK